MCQVKAVFKFRFILLLKFWGQIIECGTSRLSNDFPSRQHTGNHHSAVKRCPIGGSQCWKAIWWHISHQRCASFVIFIWYK